MQELVLKGRDDRNNIMLNKKILYLQFDAIFSAVFIHSCLVDSFSVFHDINSLARFGYLILEPFDEETFVCTESQKPGNFGNVISIHALFASNCSDVLHSGGKSRSHWELLAKSAFAPSLSRCSSRYHPVIYYYVKVDRAVSCNCIRL